MCTVSLRSTERLETSMCAVASSVVTTGSQPAGASGGGVLASGPGGRASGMRASTAKMGPSAPVRASMAAKPPSDSGLQLELRSAWQKLSARQLCPDGQELPEPQRIVHSVILGE